MVCLDEISILDLLEGRLAADEEIAARAHVDVCDECRELIAEVSRSIAAEQLGEGGGHRERVGRYLLLDVVGAGSMGVVYAAHDPRLGRKVALKLINPEGRIATGELSTALVAEAQAMAKLSHPAVVAVHDAGVMAKGQVYVVMEYVDGVTLKQWCAAATRDWHEILDKFLEAGQGLVAAHRAGLVHGDFKPANVLVDDDGRVRVTDFGLARPRVAHDVPGLDAAPGAAQAQPQRVGGTPAYMGPELFAGQRPSASTDQFSFCVALYEALYGERPFEGASAQELALHTSREKIKPLSGRSRVPGAIREVIVRGLAANPTRRYSDVATLLRALHQARYRTRRLAAAAALTAGVALIGIMGHRELVWRRQVCAGAEARLTGVWDPVRRSAVKQAFDRSGASFAPDAWRGVAAAVDRHAAQWTAARTDACLATRVRGEQSAEKMDRRMECLDGNLRHLEALIQVLAEADREVVARANEAVMALPPVADCHGAAPGRPIDAAPADPAARARIDQLRASLARASALERAGRYQDAAATIAPLRGEAAQVGWLRLEAEVQALAGRVAGRLGDNAGAAKELTGAAEAAMAGGYDDLAARVMLDQIYFVGHAAARFDDAMRWDRFAELAISRAGDLPERQAERQEVRSIILWDLGRLDEAMDALARARDIYQREWGADHVRVAFTLDGIATILFEQGELIRAKALNLEAVQAGERVLGPRHPALLAFLNNLGNTEALLGEYDDARRALERAIAIAEEVLGPAHPDLVPPLDSLSSLLRLMGRYDEAEAHLRRATQILVDAGRGRSPEQGVVLTDLAALLTARGEPARALEPLARAQAILVETLGREHPQLAGTLVRRGQALLALERPREALDALSQAQALVEATLGEDVRALVEGLIGAGEAQLALGQIAEAVASFERAMRICAEKPGDPRELDRARFALSRALWRSEDATARARAKRLAEEAKIGFEAHGWAAAELEAVRAWLGRIQLAAVP